MNSQDDALVVQLEAISCCKFTSYNMLRPR